MGKLNHIAFGSLWLKHLLGNIYVSLATALHLNNSHLIRTSQWFRDTLCTIRIAPSSTEGNAKWAFHTGANACSVQRCPILHYIGSDLHLTYA